MIGLLVSLAGGLAFCALGAGGLIAPAASGRGYGIPATTPQARAYVRATAARDLVLGAVVLVLAARGDRTALALTLALATVAAIVDGINTAGMRNATIHAGGALALVVAAILVASGR
ncbi:MAG: DUF4267 domain-containing protein [Candidatus Velthaea sp.]